MGIFTTALSYINTVKFSIKIPHLTSTVHRLLSDHLLCWKEPILSSYSFLGVLRKEKPFSLIFLRAVVNISIQTLIISPWLLFRKMIDDHLTAGAWAACDQTRNASSQWHFSDFLYIKSKGTLTWKLPIIPSGVKLCHAVLHFYFRQPCLETSVN